MGRQKQQQDSDEIAQALIDFIVQASSRITASHRNKIYSVPFIAPVPQEITQICRLMTGYNLHAARGIEDEDGTIQAAANLAMEINKQILGSQIVLDLPRAKCGGKVTGGSGTLPNYNVGIPPGGTDGQALVKMSGENYDAMWRDAGTAENGIPVGGLTGYGLVKRSADDFDAQWQPISGGGGSAIDFIGTGDAATDLANWTALYNTLPDDSVSEINIVGTWAIDDDLLH